MGFYMLFQNVRILDLQDEMQRHSKQGQELQNAAETVLRARYHDAEDNLRMRRYEVEDNLRHVENECRDLRHLNRDLQQRNSDLESIVLRMHDFINKA